MNDYLQLASIFDSMWAPAYSPNPLSLRGLCCGRVTIRLRHSAGLIRAVRYAIARRMSPVKHGGNPACGGIQQLETDQFTLHCLRTHTGLKFFILTDPHSLGASKFLQNSYQLYTDYVLKNPFYQLDQPIQEKLFNEMLIQMAELERVGRINEFDWP